MIKPNTKPVATAQGAATNKKKGSLVKTIVLEDGGQWVRPASGAKFHIDQDAKFPEIMFEIETASTEPYEWTWSISWPAAVSGLKESINRGKVLKTFSKSGKFSSSSKIWIVDLSEVVGGALTVKVKAGTDNFKRSIFILGNNPSESTVTAFLSTLEDVKGFDKLLAQESKFKNFINIDEYPVVAFDGGYGMTQMTNPAPSFTQVWSWKENIKGGAELYKSKQAIAKKYLSKDKRTYTDEQLKLETWSLWNGGNYHVWDDSKKLWTRNPTILGDKATGNIGWDMTKSENKGKTESELHERDKDQYKKPPSKSDRLWMYSGVCYADHVNNE
jgi:hypothetical protein